MARGRYLFERAADAREKKRLWLIESIFDPASQRRLVAAGLKKGQACLEIGPGAGSMMRWAAQRVGPRGQVVAIDVNPRFLRRARVPNARVLKGDVQTLRPAGKKFDFAFGRYVLIHIATPERALRNIRNCLKKGASIVLEEPAFSLAAPGRASNADRAAAQRVNRSILRMFERKNLDPDFGLSLPVMMERAGFRIRSVEVSAPLVRGGTPLARMMAASTTQLRDEYTATGLASPRDVTRAAQLAKKPSFWAVYYGTVSVTARRT